MKCTLKVREITGTQALSDDDGDKLFKLIESSIEQGLDVEVDFTGVEDVLTLYLNSAIAPLYGKYTSAELNDHLSVIGLGSHTKSLLRVIKNAKIFYANKSKMQTFMDEVYNEE